MSLIMTPSEQMAIVTLLQFLSLPGMRVVIDSERRTMTELVLGHTEYCVLRNLEGRINDEILASLEPEEFPQEGDLL